MPLLRIIEPHCGIIQPVYGINEPLLRMIEPHCGIIQPVYRINDKHVLAHACCITVPLIGQEIMKAVVNHCQSSCKTVIDTNDNCVN